MLLSLAFCALVFGTSLADQHQQHQQQQQQPQECCHEVLQSLTAQLDSLTKKLNILANDFYTIHGARIFGSGSEKLFLTNEHEGNFVTVNSTCNLKRGFVPSPENEAENNALRKVLLRHNKSAYLGHIPAGYSNWAPGEPSSAKSAKTCVKIDTDGKWSATSCEEHLLIVCAFSVVGPSKSIHLEA